MSLTNVSTQQVSRAGLTPAFAAANVDGSYIPNDGRMMLEVKNTGSQITVTVETPGTVDGLAVGDLVVIVPATSGDKMIGPFPTDIYNQPDGTIKVTFTAVSGVTVAAIRL
jgi:hypothetical protein